MQPGQMKAENTTAAIRLIFGLQMGMRMILFSMIGAGGLPILKLPLMRRCLRMAIGRTAKDMSRMNHLIIMAMGGTREKVSMSSSVSASRGTVARTPGS
jgi:hypothetical protein